MNGIDLAAFILAMLLGILALKWARNRRIMQETQKVVYEKEAIERLTKELEIHDIDSQQYRIFFYNQMTLFGRDKFREVNFDEMRSIIIKSVTILVPGGGVAYHEARFSLKVIQDQKSIFFVVRDGSFDFEKLFDKLKVYS